MARFIKRKQIDISINDAKKGSYGVEDNKANLREKDQLELALDKISVLLDGRSVIQLDQIWAESKSIPDTASIVNGIVAFVNQQYLNPLSGHPTSYRSPLLNNIIPESFGDKTSYKYVVKKSTGVVINMKTEHGYVDPLSGTVTFVNGNPSGVSHSNPPNITCYKYVGKTAEDTGIGGSGSVSSSDTQWQNSVINFTTTLPVSSLGDRYIYNGSSGTNTDIIIDGEVVNGNIFPDDIISWEEPLSGTNSSNAWKVYSPTNATFTSVTSEDNVVYYWRSFNKWKQYRDERTYPIELDLIPQDTFVKSGTYGYGHVLSDTQIVETATPNTDFNLHINGVKIPDEYYDFVSVTENTGAIYSTSGSSVNEIIFSGSYTVNTGDLVLVNSTIWRTVTAINGNVITYSGTDITDTTASLYTYVVVTGNFPVTDSIILLKGGLTYDIESGSSGDHLTFNYVKPIDE